MGSAEGFWKLRSASFFRRQDRDSTSLFFALPALVLALPVLNRRGSDFIFEPTDWSGLFTLLAVELAR